MFGHALRMPEETTAQKLLKFAVIGSNNYQATTNLFDKLLGDLQNLTLNNLQGLIWHKNQPTNQT